MSDELITPNEAMKRACDGALGGKWPETRDEWRITLQYLARHVMAREIAEQACVLFIGLYDIPLEAQHVRMLVKFQLAKERAHLN